MARFKKNSTEAERRKLMGEKQYGIDENVWVNMRNKSRKYTTLAYK